MSIPASFYQAEADWHDIPDDEEDDRVECPWCQSLMDWNEGHPACVIAEEAVTCYNPECSGYNTVWVDYEQGDPCERCGEPIGRTVESECQA